MEELNEFFSKPPRRIALGSTISSDIRAKAALNVPPPRISIAQRQKGLNYVEEELKMETDGPSEDFNDEDSMDLERESEDEFDEDDYRQATLETFRKFNLHEKTSVNSLPISSERDRILRIIRSQSITIIEGPTGCGKSTQIPYWILRDGCIHNEPRNIIVTQPRRIAAISIAKRVCAESKTAIGELIGYKVGMNKKFSSDTRLQFVTTRILLNDLVLSRNMNKYTHIILDEVHERENEMDFLLIVIKKLLKFNSQKVKIILMSATFDVQQFSNYFATKICNSLEAVPIYSLPSKRQYSLHIYYSNELTKVGELPRPDYYAPTISNITYEFTLKLLNSFEKMDQKTGERCSVLIFLPGIREIEEMYTILENEMKRKDIDPYSPIHKWWSIPLHSTITSEEQNNVFKEPPVGFRKIILSTNIAESSITVPDVKYVIDFCLTKTVIYNAGSNFSSLQLCWASKNNCTQRAGRAGRVSDGRVYRLIPEEFYETLSDEPIPEIKRCPLENLILLAKRLNMGSPKHILALALDPPDLSNIYSTILTLKEVGALRKTLKGKLSHEDGDLTVLGKIMSNLPLDIKITKLIVLGYIFGCINDCIIIGAALNVKNVFNTPFMQKMNAYNSKLTWAFGSTSDCIALLNVYKVYKQLERNKFSAFNGKSSNWANSMFLQLNSIKDIDYLVVEIKHVLRFEGFDIDNEQQSVWNATQTPLILKMIIAGAFFPNYFNLSGKTETHEREAVKELNGKDPYNTIYFLNMNNNQPGILYTSQIKNFFKNTISDSLNVDFDANSSKIFISAQNIETKSNIRAKIPGKTSLLVYQAVKMRQLRYPFVLNVMPREKALERAARLKLIRYDADKVQIMDQIQMECNNPPLPGIDQTYIEIKISNMEDCSTFWSHNCDAETQNNLKHIIDVLNSPSNAYLHLKTAPMVGRLYSAPFKSENGPNLYYRVRLEKLLQDDQVSVFYIDYGNRSKMCWKLLRNINTMNSSVAQMKPLAFKCCLAELSPSLVKSSRGVWTDEANNRFRSLVLNKKLHGKVYSVHNFMVSLELFANNISVNELLLKEGHAQTTEESYASKVNHDLRERAQDFSPLMINIYNKQQMQDNSVITINFPPPEPEECTEKIHLKGPYSPLETSIHSLLYDGRSRDITVDWDSVNSVILATDFQPSYGRLLISTFINESPSGRSLCLRNTTLMPNIPGLTELLVLIFCPTAQIHRNDYGDTYISLLAGLGHENGESLYPEHDMFLNMNVIFTNEDMDNINFLRKTLSQALMNVGESMNYDINETPMIIKNSIEKLISTPRRGIEYMSNNESLWKQTNLEDDDDDSEYEIYPQHRVEKLCPQNAELLMTRAKENEKLYDICKGLINDGKEVACTLCNTEPMNIPTLRLHIFSRMHKDFEAELQSVYEDD